MQLAFSVLLGNNYWLVNQNKYARIIPKQPKNASIQANLVKISVFKSDVVQIISK